MQKRNQRSNTPAPKASGKSHLKLLITLLAVWVVLFVIVLLEHGRSWARLLPMLFLGIVLYGVFVTRRLIKENNSNRE